MEATLYTHLRVRADLLDMQRVEADLYVSNLDYQKKAAMGYAMAKKDYPGLCLWEEDGDHVILPRGYEPPWLHDHVHYIDDLRPEWPYVEGFHFNTQLRNNQYAAADALAHPGRKTDKLLCLGCGKGKTVLALWYTVYRSVRTLIIVDRDFLIVQWQKRIQECLGLEKTGLIQDSRFDVYSHITIASIATLRTKLEELGPEFYDQFGLVIVDEAHLLGAPEAVKVLPNFPGERLLLTATPTRKDGMHPAFMYHAGGLTPVFTDLTRDQSSVWTFIELSEVLTPEQRTGLYQKRREWKHPRLLRPRYETRAGESLEFNLQILREVFRAEHAGRNVLVLGSRVEQLQALCDAAIEAKTDASLVVGKVKDVAREDAFTHRVIFATWQIAGRALDIDRLDTLILLYPNDDEGFLRQAVGRIDRTVEGKKTPVVVVFSHTAHLQRKADQMLDTIREIDPGARITTVRRAWQKPRSGRLESMLVGGIAGGTAVTPGLTPKGTSRPFKEGSSS